MASKKKHQKAKPKAKATKKAPAKVVKMAAKKTAKRTASPRSQVLPGMEQVRNRSLDHLCEELSDVRRDINRLNADEDSLAEQAMTVMSRGRVGAYRHAGIELGLQTGQTKLRIRVLKDKTENTSVPAIEAPKSEAVEALDALTEPVTDDEREAAEA